MTLMTSRPDADPDIATATGPAASVSTIACQPWRSRIRRRPPAASSSGTSQAILVASAEASTTRVSGVSSTGNRSIRPSVCREAHASAARWSGTGPASTASGPRQSRNAGRSLAWSDHTATAALTAGCGSSRSLATWCDASSAGSPMAASSRLRVPPVATGAASASSNQAPSGEVTP